MRDPLATISIKKKSGSVNGLLINFFQSAANLRRQFLFIFRNKGFGAAIKAGLRFSYFRFLEYCCRGKQYKGRNYRKQVARFDSSNTDLIVKNIHGHNMFLSIHDTGLSSQLLMNGTREKKQTQIVNGFLKPGMVVMDIGANLGYYTLIEADRVGPSGKVYAIEPVPFNFQILTKNIALNHFQERVELHNLAISDCCGQSKIATTQATNIATMFFNDEEVVEGVDDWCKTQVKDILEVPTLTLDEFTGNKITPDFIRMDVEGYELIITRGMRETLHKCRPGAMVFMELHPGLFKRKTEAVMEIFNTFGACGFEVKYIVDSSGTRTLDFSASNPTLIIFDNIEACFGVFWLKR